MWFWDGFSQNLNWSWHVIKHHLHHKFGIGESDMCPCNTEPMIVNHVLKWCPKHATLGEEILPKWNWSPGATVWQPGASPPDDSDSEEVCLNFFVVKSYKWRKSNEMETQWKQVSCFGHKNTSPKCGNLLFLPRFYWEIHVSITDLHTSMTIVLCGWLIIIYWHTHFLSLSKSPNINKAFRSVSAKIPHLTFQKKWIFYLLCIAGILLVMLLISLIISAMRYTCCYTSLNHQTIVSSCMYAIYKFMGQNKWKVSCQMGICGDIEAYLEILFFFFFFTEARGAASNSAYYGYPELWILRYPAQRYHTVPSPGFEPMTLWLRVRRPSHSADCCSKRRQDIRDKLITQQSMV
jgi:hypothetical protein